MKKISIILLALVMLVALCSCIGETNVRGEIKNETSADTAFDTASDTPSDTASEGGSDAVMDEVTEEAETKVNLDFGETEGTVYENAFIGIGYNLDEGWSFYSDEQIKELNNIAADMMPEDAQEMLENASVIYDMYATDADGVNSININLEKANALQLIGLDLAQNFELVAPTLKATYENMGYTDYTYEITETEIEGEAFFAVKSTAMISGINMYQMQIQKKCNGYLATITITSFIDDITEDLVDNFYLIK